MPEAKLPLRHLIQSPPSQARPLRAPLGHRTFLCQKAGLLLGLSPPSCHRKGQCHSFLVNTPKSPPSPAGNLPNSGSAARPQSQGLPNLSPRLNLLQPAPPHPPELHQVSQFPLPPIRPAQTLPKSPRAPPSACRPSTPPGRPALALTVDATFSVGRLSPEEEQRSQQGEESPAQPQPTQLRHDGFHPAAPAKPRAAGR